MKKDTTDVVIRRSPVIKKHISRREIMSSFALLALSLGLLTWLVGAGSPAQKAAVAQYFRTPENIAMVKQVTLVATRAMEEKNNQENVSPQMLEAVEQAQQAMADQERMYVSIERQVRDQLDSLPPRFAQALQIAKTDKGIRLEILEQKGEPMFARGSHRLMPVYRKMVLTLASELAATGKDLSIYGHTDATPFSHSSRHDNWTLSTSRAQEARRVLVQGGFPAVRIRQVAGMADRELRDPRNPEAASNRRVELILDAPAV